MTSQGPPKIVQIHMNHPVGRVRRYGRSRKYSFKFPYLGIYFWRIKAQCALRCAHAAAAASMNVHKYCARVVSLKHSRPTSRLPRAASALGLNSENPPKIKIREIDVSYSCLQRVDKCSACYYRKRKLLWDYAETCLENSWNDNWGTLFFGGF